MTKKADLAAQFPVYKMARIDEIEPYARNSRKHSPEQVEQIADSIRRFGLVGGIVVKDGVIAKGHGTLEAIKHILKSGDLIYPAPGRDQGSRPFPPDKVPVLDASGWTEEQFRAYVIADNRLSELSFWDVGLLGEELAELSQLMPDFALPFDIDISESDINPSAELPDALESSGSHDDEVSQIADRSGESEDPRQQVIYPVILNLHRVEYLRWCEVKKTLGVTRGEDALICLMDAVE